VRFKILQKCLNGCIFNNTEWIWIKIALFDL
jgi:hypothetical protein